MNWLDKLRGKAERPDGPPAELGEAQHSRIDQPASSTVLRASGPPTPSIARSGVRFRPNQEITADLQIKTLLGSGAMGEVYLARQRLWDMEVALKIPNDEILSDPENRHRIIREAEAWTELGLHPNIAYCHYVQPLAELLLMVIEYADAGNLRDWIATGRCADLKAGMDLAIQFCHGLERAHSRRLVHRDIKPENVLLMQDGTLKITDFGIVRRALSSSGGMEARNQAPLVADGMTMVGIGTPDYMAPEQREDQRKIDSGVDIFGFGVCLYEMLCGRRPYSNTAGSRQEAPEPTKMRGGKALPKRLCHLMKSCVDWDRDRRPAGAREVREELCAVYEDMFGEPCPHAELPDLTTLADDWNNRALSYLVLGRADAAEEAWRTALESDPRHAESTYNYDLHRWRAAKVTDREIVTNLRGVAESAPSSWLPRYLLAQVHMERRDPDAAAEELAKIQGEGAKEAVVIAARRAVDEWPPAIKQVRTFQGGASPVYLSADMRYAISGSRDNNKKLDLWEVATGRALRSFEGHLDSVLSVCLSADGQIALSGSRDRTLKLWEVERALCLSTFQGHTEPVVSVCLSADGRLALSGGRDCTLKLWDTKSGSCERTFEGHTGSVESVSLSEDGRHALSGSSDNTLKLWDVARGSCLRTFQGHTDLVLSACLSADGHCALSGSADKTLKLWDVESGHCLRTFEERSGWIQSVKLSTDGRYALSGGADEKLKFWEVKSGRLEGETEKSGTIDSADLSLDGRFALSAGRDGPLKYWELNMYQPRATFRLGRLAKSAEYVVESTRYAAALSDARTAAGAGDTVQAYRCLRRARQEPRFRRARPAVREWAKLYVQLRRSSVTDGWPLWKATNDAHQSTLCLSANGHYGMSAGSHTVKLWEMESGLCRRTLDTSGWVEAVCLSADGRWALSAGKDNSLKLWEMEEGNCLRTFEGHSGKVYSVCLSVDGQFAMSGSEDKTLRLWEVQTGRCLRTEEIDFACLSGDGRLALSSGRDYSMTLWSVDAGSCLRQFKRRDFRGAPVCLSVDGRYALSADSDHKLTLWEVENGHCLRTLRGHTAAIRAVCLSSDERFALSGGDDKTVRLWDLESGCCLRVLEHDAAVTSAVLSPNGQYALTLSGNGTITAWFLDWDLEEHQPADWDAGAQSYLEIFLRAHRPPTAALPAEVGTGQAPISGGPVWTGADVERLLFTLGCAGYGWLRREGVLRQLQRMTGETADAFESPQAPAPISPPRVAPNESEKKDIGHTPVPASGPQRTPAQSAKDQPANVAGSGAPLPGNPSGGKGGQRYTPGAPHPADYSYRLARELAAQSNWGKALEELKRAVDAGHPEAIKMQRELEGKTGEKDPQRFHGAQRPLSPKLTCPVCKGYGICGSASAPVRCSRCGGRGWAW